MRETKFWTWHMAAGVVIALLLGQHMVIMHLGGRPIQAKSYNANAGFFYLAADILGNERAVGCET